LTLILVGAFLLSGSEVPESWPQWRGPERTGLSQGPAWPDSLGGLQRQWHVELGKGYPGPIVAEDRVFVAETANGDTEVVRALDRKTGKELWQASWKGKVSVPFFAKRNGDWIRSTPAYDAGVLYVGGMEEVLVALDGKSGRELWRVDFPKRFNQPVPDFGFASSPLVDGDFIYLQAANSVVKLNKRDGSTVWRTLPTKDNMFESGAFSSPLIATLCGKRQLVVATRTSLAGVDLGSGQPLWMQEVPHFRGMNILTPVVAGDTVFASTYRHESYLFQIKQVDGKFTSTELWKNKVKGYMSTPVRIGDHIYLHLQNQRVTCLNLVNGENPWTTEPFGTYWSMAVRKDKILALDDRGQLLLVKASPAKFELLDSREISTSPTWGHIAVAGDEIFVRELTGITAYRLGAAMMTKAD
jgi:outer membrane protein assembly factor BamB